MWNSCLDNQNKLLIIEIMDCRDKELMNGPWYESFDEKTMTVTVTIYNEEEEEIEASFPVEFEVCGICSGKGSHVNPSIDYNGISAEEFYDDPEFAEDYFGGTYDVPCYRCHGKRVEPIINEENLSKEQKEDYKLFIEKQINDEEYCREVEMERRMGA